MKKEEIKKPDKITILTAAVVVLTFIIGTAFIYKPFLNNVSSLRAEILKERDRNILAGTIRALGKYLKIYRKRLPKGRGVSWLLNNVSDMTNKEGIEMSSVKPGTPEDRGLYTRLYVTMDTASSYQQLGKFIARVESSESFLKMEHIEIKRFDMEEGFDAAEGHFKQFDVKAHIEISTIALKE